MIFCIFVKLFILIWSNDTNNAVIKPDNKYKSNTDNPLIKSFNSFCIFSPKDIISDLLIINYSFYDIHLLISIIRVIMFIGGIMKVLSIKEPFASLIKNRIKCIETRSWKSNYRGELYIHASLSKMVKYNDRLELMDLIKDMDMSYGYIICKCKLVDCIYMDEEFINNIKGNHREYICGEYSVGRYAWVLDSVEILDKPIKAKGKLGIWNYDNI